MIRVTAESGAGVGYELTEEIEGLTWSNVNPGGDETANFTFKRPWFSENPEIDRGNVLRITEGLDVLWQGRIEEHGRSADETEQIEVTAYGLGQRLKDNLFGPMPYVDQDFNSWGGQSTTRRLENLNAGSSPYDPSVAPDTQDLLPALLLAFDAEWNTNSLPTCEGWYDSGPGGEIGEIHYAFRTGPVYANSNFAVAVATFNKDYNAGATSGGNTGDVFPNAINAVVTGKLVSSPGHRYARVIWNWTAALANNEPGRQADVYFTQLVVYGRHGLTPLSDGGGFTADQIVGHAVVDADGIVVRRIEPQTFEIPHFKVEAPAPHEDVVEAANAYEACDWGTWGPDSVLDRSDAGYFEYRDQQQDVQHWSARRADLDDLDIQAELNDVFDVVVVNFEDAAGVQNRVERTAHVPILAEQNIHRTATIDGGKLTTAQAEALGDTFLILAAGYSPGRGSLSTSQPIAHHQRGELPPQYLRADGSNVRVSDILPSETMLTLDSAPDRRTTFPIKRVEVDASGDKVSAQVELDQTNDPLSLLAARFAIAGQRGRKPKAPQTIAIANNIGAQTLSFSASSAITFTSAGGSVWHPPKK